MTAGVDPRKRRESAARREPQASGVTRVGTIGAGNMAEAILRGLIRSGTSPERLRASDPDPARREHVAKELGVPTTRSNAEVVANVDVVVVAVKPDRLEEALRGLGPEPLYVSIVAGRTLGDLRALLGPEARLVRAMPNTPALVGCGVTAIAAPADADPADLDAAQAVLEAVGAVLRLPEPQLDAVTGLSGSGPAYVYLFIESLTEAGVREGLAPDVARALAVRTVEGAARLADESGEHPAILRERVTSPGGTTAAGLAALEEGGLRATIGRAVRAATARSRELSRRD